jgi:Raf kinase inhibitor-like YbhB/YbcL family protein
VLILDESSAALDFDATERLFKKLRELKREDVTILIVSHRVAELVRIADRATVLRDGADVGSLEKDEITEERILALVAGEARNVSQSDHDVPQQQGSAPILRIERARIWDDSTPIDFALYPGEIVGITGLDGQGQSDFVRCIAGVSALRGGTISLLREGASHEITDLTSARQNRVSYVSGDRKTEGIFANLSIYENLLLPVYREYRVGGFLNLLNYTKLNPIFEWESSRLAVKMGSPSNLITSLSGGNQQKVLIARAFAEKPAVLVLNDPARGIDVGAKLDLYRNLRQFAERGGAVLFLSSEIEEFLDLCTRVCVFRNGTVSSEFEPPFDSHVLLNAMFGRKATAALFETDFEEHGEVELEQRTGRPSTSSPIVAPRQDDGRPAARSVPVGSPIRDDAKLTGGQFTLASPAFAPNTIIPARFAEDSKVSPPLVWDGAPEGTRSFALSITDPDLPPEFKFPRAFAHWLVYDIPADVRTLVEGASGSSRMPAGAKELASDFVTFKIPGFGIGYGGPWPPDRAHRYVFTVHAMMVDRLEFDKHADLATFMGAVASRAIASASFIALYGPARKPLPT